MQTTIETLLTDYKKKSEATWLSNVMQLNIELIAQLQKQKANSKLRKLTAIKIFAVIIGIIWIGFLSAIIRGTYFINPYFTFSVSLIIIANIIAVAVYTKQVVLIQQVNFNDSITNAQKKLSQLQLSTLNITRILFLQLPLYVTCWWNTSWIHFNELKFWLIPFPIALAFTFAAIWLFKNISIENSDKKWFKILFKNPEYSLITDSKEFLKVIADFEKE